MKRAVLWGALSLVTAVLLSGGWLAVTGVWVYTSEFAEGFAALARGERLTAAARHATWSSGYRIQWFVSYLLPVLHAGSVAWVQRRIFPERSGALALLAVLPGTFVLLLVALLVIYDAVAVFVVVASFVAAATVMTREKKRREEVQGVGLQT